MASLVLGCKPSPSRQLRSFKENHNQPVPHHFLYLEYYFWIQRKHSWMLNPLNIVCTVPLYSQWEYAMKGRDSLILCCPNRWCNWQSWRDMSEWSCVNKLRAAIMWILDLLVINYNITWSTLYSRHIFCFNTDMWHRY